MYLRIYYKISLNVNHVERGGTCSNTKNVKKCILSFFNEILKDHKFIQLQRERKNLNTK